MREFRIEPRAPYSLAFTAERLGRFSDGIDRFDGEVFERLVFFRSDPLLIRVSQTGSVARPELRVRLQGAAADRPGAAEAARELVARMLGTQQEVQGFYRSLRDDPVLAPAIRDFRGLRVAGAASLFEALLTAILSQQVNLVFAYSIRRELAQRYGRRARIDSATWVGFPTPRRLASLGEDELRTLRLTGAKSRAIAALAEAFRSGRLREAELASQGDEEAIEALIALPGIGRWTAEIGLLRGLNRPDVFPAADLAVVKVLARMLGHDRPASEAVMRDYSERWRPHRSLALVYAYAEMARRQKQNAART